jgi:tetratricopeptide (TPR) repeat protein
VLAETAIPTGEGVTRQDTATVLFCRDALGFADALNAEGDYYRAISEYKRLLYFCESESTRSRAQMSIGEATFAAGQYGLVLDWYRALDAKEVDIARAGLIAGRALYRLGRYDDAAALLGSIPEGALDAAELADARYYEGLSLVRAGHLDRAAVSLDLVGESTPHGSKAARYAGILRDRPEVPRKSPRVAAVLGVVPGLGYAYAGHYGTAVASLAVNGLLAWATVDAFADEHRAAGGLYSLLAIGFYVGNIVGSAQSAERYNGFQESLFQAQFKE